MSVGISDAARDDVAELTRTAGSSVLTDRRGFSRAIARLMKFCPIAILKVRFAVFLDEPSFWERPLGSPDPGYVFVSQ